MSGAGGAGVWSYMGQLKQESGNVGRGNRVTARSTAVDLLRCIALTSIRRRMLALACNLGLRPRGEQRRLRAGSSCALLLLWMVPHAPCRGPREGRADTADTARPCPHGFEHCCPRGWPGGPRCSRAASNGLLDRAGSDLPRGFAKPPPRPRPITEGACSPPPPSG